MKALQFTIPVMANKTIITKEEYLPYFYPHLHRHHEVQLTWVIQGAGTLVAGNSMHPFEGGDVFWFSANQPHLFKSEADCFTNPASNNVHSLTIFFNTGSQLNSFFDIPEVAPLKDFVQMQKAGFKVPVTGAGDIALRMQQVQHTAGVEQFICFVDLLKTLAGLGNLQPLSQELETMLVKDDEGIRIASIFNYVMQHYTRPITLEEIARLVYMTPQAFCRYFKKHTHHTLVSFVNQVRITEACKQLVENRHDSIASIAYNTGFNSITNFNRVFKAVIKKSPKEYVDSYLTSVRHSN